MNNFKLACIIVSHYEYYEVREQICNFTHPELLYLMNVSWQLLRNIETYRS